MGNITTSYIRIYPLCEAVIDREDVHVLFHDIVQAHGKFGSYGVRILAHWNDMERCLDIQFGSAKACHTSDYILERRELYDTYAVWERLYTGRDEKDRIFQYVYNYDVGYVDYASRACVYGFDQVRLVGEQLDVVAQEYGFPVRLSQRVNSTTGCWDMHGTYCAGNDRSLLDLNDLNDAYDGRLYEEQTCPADFFRFTPHGDVTGMIPPFLQRFFSPAFQDTRVHTIALLWKGRVVQQAQWCEEIGDERHTVTWRVLSADFWDNCRDSEFLAFRQQQHEHHLSPVLSQTVNAREPAIGQPLGAVLRPTIPPPVGVQHCPERPAKHIRRTTVKLVSHVYQFVIPEGIMTSLNDDVTITAETRGYFTKQAILPGRRGTFIQISSPEQWRDILMNASYPDGMPEKDGEFAHEHVYHGSQDDWIWWLEVFDDAMDVPTIPGRVVAQWKQLSTSERVEVTT